MGKREQVKLTVIAAQTEKHYREAVGMFGANSDYAKLMDAIRIAALDDMKKAKLLDTKLEIKSARLSNVWETILSGRDLLPEDNYKRETFRS